MTLLFTKKINLPQYYRSSKSGHDSIEDVNVRSSTLVHNTSGAIYEEYSLVTIQGATNFTGNEAKSQGGNQ